MKLGEIAVVLGAELRGDPEVEISGVSGIESAGPSDLTFVANVKYNSLARTTLAGAVLVAPGFPEIKSATLRIGNPYLGFARAAHLFYQPPAPTPGIHPTAQIASTARIGKGASIAAYAVILDNVTIGERATLLPHVVLYPGVTVGDDFTAHAHSVVRENCRIGDRVILQNGVIIGGDGFGFAKDDANRWHKIPQSGPVVIEDDVEIQSLAAIDRASVGETRIGRGSKIDNLVQVGHGSLIGEDTLLCAQVGLAGSTEVGDRVILAGQVGVVGHLRIGDDVIVTGQSGIHGDVEPGKILSGSPAFDNRQWLRATAIFARLPQLVRGMGRRSADDSESASESSKNA